MPPLLAPPPRCSSESPLPPGSLRCGAEGPPVAPPAGDPRRITSADGSPSLAQGAPWATRAPARAPRRSAPAVSLLPPGSSDSFLPPGSLRCRAEGPPAAPPTTHCSVVEGAPHPLHHPPRPYSFFPPAAPPPLLLGDRQPEGTPTLAGRRRLEPRGPAAGSPRAPIAPPIAAKSRGP